MGEAKRRGTYEERAEMARVRDWCESEARRKAEAIRPRGKSRALPLVAMAAAMVAGNEILRTTRPSRATDGGFPHTSSQGD